SRLSDEIISWRVYPHQIKLFLITQLCSPVCLDLSVMPEHKQELVFQIAIATALLLCCSVTNLNFMPTFSKRKL
ncbi:MAG: hypothetical protein EBQ52_00450, partial [Synechococcaceae bacterium LLD_019]|nr:hypothetical protein [Synechococcaceae bacterium LLD_019]